jgi:putative ABC transport system permease protein
MSLALGQRTVERRPGNGGVPARRAVFRWAWRLFRREWRQQALVLSLLIVAVAATTVGLAVVPNVVSSRAEAEFGTADHIVSVAGSPQTVSADVAAARAYFGTIDVIAHQKIGIPGSLGGIDLRAQDPHGRFGSPTLRLDAGRYPVGPNEVAVTSRVAAIFNLHIGETWQQRGTERRVVGLVENPNNLLDAFALVAPGQLSAPSAVAILVQATETKAQSFHLPGGGPVFLMTRSTSDQRDATIGVLVLTTIGLLFVGLLSVGGFAVLAGRRQRALGMLGAVGATDRHLRLVMLANGIVVGAVGAVTGAATGLGLWLAFAGRLETLAERRFDRFHLSWWAIGAALLLAVLTAFAAAWWPARAAARVSIVSALSGRPPRPRPARGFAAPGGLLLAVGVGLLVLAHQKRPALIVIGIVATTVGLLLLAPLSIRGLAAAGRRSPIAVRLSLRDLARYQLRSAAALGAITLAIGIAATIAITAAAQATTDPSTGGTLPANQLMVYLGVPGNGAPVPELDSTHLRLAQAGVGAIAAKVGSHHVLALQEAINPAGENLPAGQGNGPGGKVPASLAKLIHHGRGFDVSPSGALYIATPAVLARYGITTGNIDPTTDLLTSRTDITGLALFSGPRNQIAHPKVQTVNLPRYSSDPNTLITPHAMQTLSLQARPAAWLIQTPRPLTTSQIDAVSKDAAAAGLTIETRDVQPSLTRLRNDATAAGVLVALGVLAMTVGLIRSETGRDLRTLAAIGAGRTTRRTLTGATAGCLALLGALLGTAGAYLALLAWYHHRLHSLTNVPIADLSAIVVGLPILAAIAGWLLAGRESNAIARQPLE